MNKVMCIDDDWHIAPPWYTGDFPKLYEVYQPTGYEVRKGVYYYIIFEITELLAWDARAFVDISEIDETEMERNYQPQKQET